MMTNDPQRDLFPEDTHTDGDHGRSPTFTSNASLQAALGFFEKHMQDEGFAYNTVKAFLSDIRLLGKYMGIGQPIGGISTKNLNDFMRWIDTGRGQNIPCSPKSYARRVTTLKVFFGWLHESGVLPNDPSTAVIQKTVKSPLPPNLPDELDLQNALAVTQTLREGINQSQPDARPHLLLTLLLQTAIKKGEVMRLVPNHIDRENPDAPLLLVRYANPRLRVKERKIPLDPEWLDVLDEYLEQYEPTDTLFTCTARNLEYILSDVGEEAGLEQGVLSFENLRWTAALRDYRTGVELDDLRQKLGLSKITWRETKNKLERLHQMQTEGVLTPEQ